MKRSIRNWRLILFGALVAIVACAILVWFLTPFAPRVTINAPQMAFCGGADGVVYPDVSVALRNDGRLPIWYRGNEVGITNFAIEGDSRKGERHVETNQYATWTRLASGKTVSVRLPTYGLFDAARIQVELCDWRGKKATISSADFDFSSVPVDGVPGVSVRSPAPIPQKNVTGAAR